MLLKHRLKKIGLSPHGAAKQFGLGRDTVYRWAKGNNLANICQFLYLLECLGLRIVLSPKPDGIMPKTTINPTRPKPPLIGKSQFKVPGKEGA